MDKEIVLRTLTYDDIPACRALWQSRFGDSDVFCDWYFSKRFCPYLSIGLFEDGFLKSMAHGRDITLGFGYDDDFSALMIGGVSTALDAEGKGYMKRVMAEMETIGRNRYDKMLVLATETPALYTSSGFEVCAKALYAVATGENEQSLNYDASSYDIEALLDCRYAACRDDFYFPLRDADKMRDRIKELCCEGGGLLTLENVDGTWEGYAFCDPVNLRADEVIARSEDGYRKLLTMLPKGTVAMLPPYLSIEGEREKGAWLMCKPIDDGKFFHETNGWFFEDAFCPETF